MIPSSQGHELLVVGDSDKVFAEYSYKATDGSPFTALELWDGEVQASKGYDSKDEILAAAAEAESFGCEVYRFFDKDWSK